MKTFLLVAVLAFVFGESLAMKFVKVTKDASTDVEYQVEEITETRVCEARLGHFYDVRIQGGSTAQIKSAVTLLKEDGASLWVAENVSAGLVAPLPLELYRKIEGADVLPGSYETDFVARYCKLPD